MNFRGFIHSFLPCVPRSSTTIGSPIQDSLKGKNRRVTINTLPDDVLVDIFYFYVNDWDVGTSGWHTLVHVCQKWRYVVFASPRRLNLRLLYTGKRPMSEMLDDWPVLPVMISLETHSSLIRGNITAFLNSEHHHRICGISMLPIPASDLEIFVAAMQKPFPELTSLYIWVEESRVTSLPLQDSFLGGSAPLLRRLVLRNCPFPGLPKLLLSANHLVILSLWTIPDSGYFSPQALGAALSVMSRLAALRVEFQLPRYPTSRPPLPLTRSVLPSLTRLVFEGVHEYLEDLLAQIEAPLLNKLRIIFFMDPQFVIPQLHRLINFAESFKKCHTAFVYTSYDAIRFAAFRETHQFPELSFDIRWGVLGRPLSLLAQVCSSSLHVLSALVQLDIVVPVLSFPQSHWVISNTRWLELLDPFTAVKDLRLSDQVAPHVCQALEELSEERAPALQNIFLQGLESLEPVPNFIERVVAARRLSGHPVTVYPWEGRGNYDESTGMIF